MNDDSAKSRLDISEVSDITKELNNGRLSRQGLRERLTALGVGFGAAFVLGEVGPGAKSAEPALKELLNDSKPEVRRAAGQALERIEEAAKLENYTVK